MTAREARAYLRSVDTGAIRRQCGIAQATVARALSVSQSVLCSWERYGYMPRGPRAARYARVVAGMQRHAEVGRD